MLKKVFTAIHRHVSFAAMAIVICAGALGLVTYYYTSYASAHKMSQIILNNEAQSLQRSTARTLDQVYWLEGLVIGADGDDVDLEASAAQLLHGTQVEYVLLAPGGIVSDVYPSDTYQNLLGLNLYAKDQDTSDAQNTRDAITTGPYGLSNGDKVISSTLSVWIPNSSGVSKLWGLVSVTINYPKTIEAALSSTIGEEGYAYEIYPAKTSSDDVDITVSNGYEDGNDEETTQFFLNHAEFVLKAYPKSGWVNLDVIEYAAIAVLIASVVVGLIARHVQNHLATLRKDAQFDELTGLLNRRAAMEDVESMLKSNSFETGAFMMLDLDHFKDINDTLGHQAGDTALKHAAIVLKTCCRSSDITGRIGGDEFIAFLSCADTTTFVEDRARTICDTMRIMMPAKDGTSVPLSCSIGIARIPEDGTTLTELYEHADAALYACKKAGRDSFSFYDEDVADDRESR
ncbi:MAG: diguanylate cyclase [Atopobiaceae bacterium]|jgi:diguanylate cyclase (GGDEF)-like protein|nr:sensor domain-containing diguanylate cyclase [Atopobiaceae bacterium]MCH4181231.1 sensor domain-containing diguanylate cyclase [Atopobiaceae bacterium]MCH4214637.1 sensor domain-containing diguanylate cyclase [Atopobiaceae bacterium]MCH4230156.1 sensor domain-containing diguanylate cyclase [Atopobiaceae bacterium]MCH4275768.1 sensor domain-containing diguanylate cyclase [Atopobiaceae bacterium]